ncbi:MAG TPA: hypothetical protein VN962_02040 [Polyangia bacterium]|nr:hypothetical protein [Polyangia bacterium]
MTFWVTGWLRAFGLTLLTELAVAVPLFATVEKRAARRIAAVTIANLATHPLVWFLFPGLALSRPARFALSETWAVAAEAIAYLTIWPALHLRRALLVSLAANAASVTAGLLLARFISGR